MPPEKQNQQPWYKRHPLLAGAGTLALGGGAAYLGDKLLNGGKLTSELLGSTQTAAESPKVIPQTAPDWMQRIDGTNDYATRVKGYQGSLAPEEYQGGAFNDKLVGASAIGTGAGMAAQAANGVANLAKHPSAVLGAASKFAGKINPVTNAVLVGQEFSNNADLAQAMGDTYGLGGNGGKSLLGGIGAVSSGLINTAGAAASAAMPPAAGWINGVAVPAAQGASTAIPRGFNDWIRNTERNNYVDNVHQDNNYELLKRLSAADKGNDMATIELIKKHYPSLEDKFKDPNLTSRFRDIVSHAYARQQ